MTPTYSIWTRDGLNGWNKGAALYTDRTDAARTAVTCVGKVVYQGGAHMVCTGVRVFDSALTRGEVIARVALAA